MNYFAHAAPFLDRPWFVAGTAAPDWLAVADRSVRLRSRHAEPLLDDADPAVAQVAGGILQHLRDDARFHQGRAFAETSLELCAQVRDALADDEGLRPAFLGHLLVELLLDAALIADAGPRLAEYYQVLDGLDADRIEAAVNRVAPRPTRRLAPFIELFRRERVLSDYAEDDKLTVRLNQVLRRVRLAPLPAEFALVLPPARRLVAGRREALLAGIPTGKND
jgi:hypothetical protein